MSQPQPEPAETRIVSVTISASNSVIVEFDTPFTGSVIDWPDITVETSGGQEAAFFAAELDSTHIQCDFSNTVVPGQWTANNPPNGPTFNPPLFVPDTGAMI